MTTPDPALMALALQTIADGNEPRPIGEAWRADRKPSKLDSCIHGKMLSEDCGVCVADFARSALTKEPPNVR